MYVKFHINLDSGGMLQHDDFICIAPILVVSFLSCFPAVPL